MPVAPGFYPFLLSLPGISPGGLFAPPTVFNKVMFVFGRTQLAVHDVVGLLSGSKRHRNTGARLAHDRIIGLRDLTAVLRKGGHHAQSAIVTQERSKWNTRFFMMQAIL
jgi:hypothetical protein